MRYRLISCRSVVWALAMIMSGTLHAQESVNLADFPTYRPSKGVSGTLKSVGSDTMNNLMTLWMEGFAKIYPNVRTQVEAKGSSTAPPALISGTATLGPMSRPMKDAEIDSFKKKFGYEPTGLRVGIDMIGVFVHKDNPIKSITMKQLDAIFSKGRKAGHSSDITTWGDLGVSGDYANRRMSIFGRNSSSGTYGFFKEVVLQGGDFKDTVKEQPGSASVIDAVGADRFGIGYCGIGFGNSSVKAVAIAPDDQTDPIPAQSKFAYTGEYPLARMLLVYVNHRPGTPLDPLRREFIIYLYSRAGQEAVEKDRVLPVTPVLAEEVLQELGIKSDG